ncbi:fucolectin-1-like [Apostichopus japonicus]|uniref:fucolectin-1-like n=1 Tax=Stichopus japonicus TaxID=307972 RepID=UPI003AB31C02
MMMDLINTGKLAVILFCLVVGTPAQTCDNGQLTRMTLCTHDVAEGKKTKQHSTYNQDGKSENAVNGNTSGYWRTRSCTGTLWAPNPWWTVDLGASYQVGSIHIYNRVEGNLGKRLLGAQVLAGTEADPLRNEIIGTIGREELLNNPIVFTLDKTVTHVSVRLPGNRQLLTLCGVEVYGVPL